MHEFMNPPAACAFTAADVLAEYRRTGDRKRTARMFCMTPAEAGKAIREAENEERAAGVQA